MDMVQRATRAIPTHSRKHLHINVANVLERYESLMRGERHVSSEDWRREQERVSVLLFHHLFSMFITNQFFLFFYFRCEGNVQTWNSKWDANVLYCQGTRYKQKEKCIESKNRKKRREGKKIIKQQKKRMQLFIIK